MKRDSSDRGAAQVAARYAGVCEPLRSRPRSGPACARPARAAEAPGEPVAAVAPVSAAACGGRVQSKVARGVSSVSAQVGLLGPVRVR